MKLAELRPDMNSKVGAFSVTQKLNYYILNSIVYLKMKYLFLLLVFLCQIVPKTILYIAYYQSFWVDIWGVSSKPLILAKIPVRKAV